MKKDREIEELRKAAIKQEQVIKELESKISENRKPIKNSRNINLPNIYQTIEFTESKTGNKLRGKVLNKQKKKSINKNLVGIQLEDGTLKDFDFITDIDEWSDAKTAHESFSATVLTKSQIERTPGAEKAKCDEIRKFADFDAFETVNDDGQYAIKTRWVVTEHDDVSKGYSLKARLCMRGDTEKEKDNVRADSPTAHKDALKLALAVAANEQFELISADIKSAFLQGRSLKRKVFVIPPPEAKQDGKLWLMKKAAYGLIDGSRLFYLQLKEKLEQLGMREVSGNSALFTMHSDGKLIGLVCSHVDDLLMAGNEKFKTILTDKVLKMFKFSKVEWKKFKYLGCQVEKLENGDISLNQNDYITNLDDVDIPAGRNSWKVNENERKIIRKVVGELLWVSLMTRPDLSFEVNRLSGNILDATIRDLKDAKLLVEKAKSNPVRLNFTKLGNREDLEVRIYTDASYNNQDIKIVSTQIQPTAQFNRI